MARVSVFLSMRVAWATLRWLHRKLCLKNLSPSIETKRRQNAKEPWTNEKAFVQHISQLWESVNFWASESIYYFCFKSEKAYVLTHTEWKHSNLVFIPSILEFPFLISTLIRFLIVGFRFLDLRLFGLLPRSSPSPWFRYCWCRKRLEHFRL